MINYKKNLKIGISGVRGIVGESFSPTLIAAFAASFGRYIGAGRVIVGRDTRSSGEMIEHAVVAGLIAVGCQPVLVGIMPTPTIQIAVVEHSACGGIAITASHNPEQWNALKFFTSSGFFLNQAEAGELLDIYNQADVDFVPEEDYRGIRNLTNAFELHKNKIFKQINVTAIRQCNFRVGVDCCNGVGALFSQDFLEELGCEVFTVHDTIGNGFERPPEPLAENLGKLAEVVTNNQCALGFAQDPDGDRLALLDSCGQALGEQYTLLLALDHVLAENPGDIVVNIQTTKAVEDIAHSYGCEVHYARVGEINVTEKLVELGAEIGGEGNCGGVIWSRVHPCRDSFVTMALMLEMMAESGQGFNEIVASMPRYVTRSLKFSCNPVQAVKIISFLSKKYSNATISRLDGIRIDFAEYWILVRQSNTEPVMRLTIEATSVSLVERLVDEYSGVIMDLTKE
jgi:phosphomannomutase